MFNEHRVSHFIFDSSRIVGLIKIAIGTTDRFEYAKHVVAESLKPAPSAWFWYGKSTLSVRILTMFARRTIWVWQPPRIHIETFTRHFSN